MSKSNAIGKGPEAAERLMEEVEAMFDMTVEQRAHVERCIQLATSSNKPEVTYFDFYRGASLDQLRISGQPIEAENYTDGDGCPDGGWVEGCGLSIRWQRGTLDKGAEGNPWNGVFPVTVLEAVLLRIGYYQSGKFECADNEEARHYIQRAIDALNRRQVERFTRGVRDTHEE